jgi:HK97 family phage prohead protease
VCGERKIGFSLFEGGNRRNLDELTQQVKSALNRQYEFVNIWEEDVVIRDRKTGQEYAVAYDVSENGEVKLYEDTQEAVAFNEVEQAYLPVKENAAPNSPDLEAVKSLLLESARTIQQERAAQKDLHQEIEQALNPADDPAHSTKETIQKIEFAKGVWQDALSVARWLRKNGFPTDNVQEGSMEFWIELRPVADFEPESLRSLNERSASPLQAFGPGPWPPGVSFTTGRLQTGVKDFQTQLLLHQLRQQDIKALRVPPNSTVVKLTEADVSGTDQPAEDQSPAESKSFFISGQVKSVDEEARTISGWVSTNDIDRGGDQVLPSAFESSFRRDPSPILLYNHDLKQPIGRVIDYKIDPYKGLWISARISKTTKDVWEMIKEKIIAAFSFGYRVLKSYQRSDGVRVISDLELFEVSAVSLPRNAAAVITNVSGKFATARDFQAKFNELSLLAKTTTDPLTLMAVNNGLQLLEEQVHLERNRKAELEVMQNMEALTMQQVLDEAYKVVKSLGEQIEAEMTHQLWVRENISRLSH